MNIVSIIPARMGSSRYPGKPMQKINGIPMIEHVFKRVSKNESLEQVVVATCDNEIFDHITSLGGLALMTSDQHERASDRCAEALQTLEAMKKTKFDIMVMVQGDEPMTHPDMITEAVEPLLTDQSVQVSNLMHKITSDEEFDSPNTIKVVCDNNSDALYFSRKPIPSGHNEAIRLKQVCVIPFRREFLFSYTDLEPTPLEIAESIDMMRVLENGFKVRMALTSHNTQAVDTLDDLVKVSALMSETNKC